MTCIYYLTDIVTDEPRNINFLRYWKGQTKLRIPIKYINEEDCVVLVSHHIKVAHDWSAAAEKLGYKKTDIIVMKRL